MILHILIAMAAGWLQRHQQQVISYLLAENRMLKAQLGGRRLRLTDTQRRHLAALAHPLGRQRLKEIATIATPDTLLRWYKRLIAQKFDGSKQRHQLGRPRVAEEIERGRSQGSNPWQTQVMALGISCSSRIFLWIWFPLSDIKRPSI